MKLKICTFLLGFLIVAGTAHAEEADDPLKRIEKKIDRIEKNQEVAHRDLLNQPLANKRFGIAINPFRILAWSDTQSFSGTFSLFRAEENVEIAFPFFYEVEEPWNENDPDDSEFTSITLDVHYRKFLGQTANGFYISGFGRLASLSGRLQDRDVDGVFVPGVEDSQLKFGVGIGIGYRIFSADSWYWGTSLSIGRYAAEGDRFVNANIDDADYIIDIELFKFGYSF